MGAIKDPKSDRGDFFQVRFAKALRLKVLTAYDKQLRELKRVKRQVQFPSPADSTVEELDHVDIGTARFQPEMAVPRGADDDLLEAEENEERQRKLDAILNSIQDLRRRDAFVLATAAISRDAAPERWRSSKLRNPDAVRGLNSPLAGRAKA